MMNLSEQIKVLDKGYVRYVTHCGSDEGIIEAARMSTDKGFQGWDKDEALLDFLWSNSHHTPFEFPDLTLEVQAPIMVFREWHRHRTMSVNEMSGRYTVLPDLYYAPELDRIQKQSTVNKQGSGEDFESYAAVITRADIRDMQAAIRTHYESYIEDGVAKEIARINNPVSQYSKMRVKANLRNWHHFLGLRMAPNAQWEIRQYANEVAKIIQFLYPRTYALFEEYSLNGAHFGKTERQLISRLLEGMNREEIESIVTLKLGVDTRKSKEFMEKIGY